MNAMFAADLNAHLARESVALHRIADVRVKVGILPKPRVPAHLDNLPVPQRAAAGIHLFKVGEFL